MVINEKNIFQAKSAMINRELNTNYRIIINNSFFLEKIK